MSDKKAKLYQSFDLDFPSMNVNDPSESGKGTDPWSDKTWGRSALNASFESAETDVFEFSADNSVKGLDDSNFEAGSFLFPAADNFFKELDGPPTVRVAMHEQLSAIYDDVSDDPACQVEGSIHVRAPSQLTNVPFSLVLRDSMGHLEQLRDRPESCQDVSNKVSRQGLHKADRVLRVTLPPSLPSQDVTIAQYICSSRIRPVPLLTKSRVQVSSRFNRVGFKIRANPGNEYPLSRVVVVLAVPPHVDGRSAKMSRKGGVWDEMKRTISWVVHQLNAGEALEVQAQFESIDGETDRTPKFPVLVRCEYPTLFSSLELKADFTDALSHPIKMKLSLSGRVLHRKV